MGEIRDQETAQIAINSALTGHLVFTTVHANNVVDVLGRFQNIGVEAYNFVSALNCILAQRLVRVNCEHCKRPVRYPDSILIESGLKPEEWRDVDFMEGAGCFECGGTGFRGRTAIHELLDLSDRIRELILDRRPSSEIKRLAREEGMTFLRESAVEKARNGRNHATRNQQGDLHRMSLLDSIQSLLPLCGSAAGVRFRNLRSGIAMSRTRGPATIQFAPLAERVVEPSPIKENIPDVPAFTAAVKQTGAAGGPPHRRSDPAR